MVIPSALNEGNGYPDGVLISTVMSLFIDLLVASGAPVETIQSAAKAAIEKSRGKEHRLMFLNLGTFLRDCMEVMCAWRRHPEFVSDSGETAPLTINGASCSFEALCAKCRCTNESSAILRVLVQFGSVRLDESERVVPLTPTFLAGNSVAGRLALDGVVHQLAGFLQVIHRNVCSVGGGLESRFERACSVKVPIELEPVLAALVRSQGQEFIDLIDEWLERHARDASASGRYVEMGAGAYFINFGDSPARSIL